MYIYSGYQFIPCYELYGNVTIVLFQRFILLIIVLSNIHVLFFLVFLQRGEEAFACPHRKIYDAIDWLKEKLLCPHVLVVFHVMLS